VTKSEANAAELLSAMERLDLEWKDRVKHEKADQREFEEVCVSVCMYVCVYVYVCCTRRQTSGNSRRRANYNRYSFTG
jgi:hypothetical protein